MDRIRRLSMQVMDAHQDAFTTDFAENKKILDQLAVVRSKGLKNEVAGYITKYLKRQADTKEAKQEEEEVEAEEAEVEETEAEETEQQESEESEPQEILVENQQESS